MLVVYLFWCSCIVCSLLLVCAVLKTLHLEKSILNEEECRSVGEARWYDDLAVVLSTQPPGVLQEALGVLEGYEMQWWYSIAAERIQSTYVSSVPHVTLHRLWGELPSPPSFPIYTCSSYLQQ